MACIILELFLTITKLVRPWDDSQQVSNSLYFWISIDYDMLVILIFILRDIKENWLLILVNFLVRGGIMFVWVCWKITFLLLLGCSFTPCVGVFHLLSFVGLDGKILCKFGFVMEYCLSQCFYSYPKIMTKKQLGRKGFIRRTLPHCCSSPKEVRTGTQTG